MIQLVAVLLMLPGLQGNKDDKSPTPAKVEFRRCEIKPAEGLTEAIDTSTNEKVYLYKQVELDNQHVSAAFLDVTGRPQVWLVHLTFTDEGAKKMGALSKRSFGKRLAILLDGKVIGAPTIESEFSKAAVISTPTKVEAERIVNAFSKK